MSCFKSQEVGHQITIVLALSALLHRLENDEVFVAKLVQSQNSRLIPHPVTVVWRRPQRHQLLIKPIYVTLLDQLVSSHDQVYLVQQTKLVHYLVPEDPSCSSTVPAPSLDVFWVRPHEICQRTLVRDFLFAIQKAHLIDGGKVRRESSMDAKDVPIDDGSQRQKIKCLIKVLPAVRVAVFFIDLIEEAVHHGNVSALMVTPQQVDAVGVFDLETEQEGDSFHRVIPPVHEVANHHELTSRNSSSLGQQIFHIIVLSVHIPCQVGWGVDTNDVGLFSHDSLDHIAQIPHCRLSDGFTSQCRLVPFFNTHLKLLSQPIIATSPASNIIDIIKSSLLI